jgi:hypothetical protein
MKTIPKRIFFYWGNKEMSWLRYMTLYSFRKFNPDWEIELYVSDVKNLTRTWDVQASQDFFSYEGKNWFSDVEKLGVKIKECPVFAEQATPIQNSDIFRWNELTTNGGFYSDMDILYIKPIEEYYQQIKNFQTGIAVSQIKKRAFYSIGFMFSAGKDEFFKDVFDYSVNHTDLTRYESAGVESIFAMLRGSEKHLMVNLTNCYEGLHHIPMNVVYPWRYTQIKQFYHRCHTQVRPETIGIHWYAGDPESQRFNNAINPDTLDNHNNTISYWLSKVLN